jgi:general L-amino acid transport system permease protein
MTDTPDLQAGGYEPGTHPDLPPPPGTVGVVGWLRQNLFSSVVNSVLTLGCIAFLVWLIPTMLNWAVFSATTWGEDRSFCQTSRQVSLLGTNAGAVDYQAMTVPGTDPAATAGKRASVKSLLDATRQLDAFAKGFNPEAMPAEFGALVGQVGVVALSASLSEATAGLQQAADETKLLDLRSAPEEFPAEVDAAITATDLAAVQTSFAALQPVLDYAGRHDGACWTLIKARSYQYMVGFYPREQAWRVAITAVLMVLALIPVLFDNAPFRRVGLIYACIFPIIAFFLLVGGLGLPHVETEKFGGFMLTVVIGLTGIVGSLPIGVMLALGRRSQMPVIRVLCVAFIEFIRGVPLITILFMGSNMLPLFLPEGVNFDKLLRALIAVTLFSSAYMAEVVRGGLQAIPKGQYEGAMALGLSYWKMMGFIVLPQALKIVIPGIVSSFIGLFKDTTLVSIIGLFDLLLVGKSAITDTKWLRLAPETYVFVATIYFCFCYAMARYSTWLEEKLHTGHKR